MGEHIRDLERSIGQSAAQCQKHKSTRRAPAWCVASAGDSVRHHAAILCGLPMPLTLRRCNMYYASISCVTRSQVVRSVRGWDVYVNRWVPLWPARRQLPAVEESDL